MSRYLIVQISDTHLSSQDVLPPGARPRENLIACLDVLADAGIEPDVLLLTGDLTQEGEAACYEDLAGLVAGAPSATGATVVYLPGNHDARAAFRRHLLHAQESSAPINAVHWRGGLRIVALDSTVPGEDFGALADETLAFLGDALASPAPDGTIVALHHPPIPSPIEPMARIGLRQPERLAEVVAGSDVRLIVCGHYHHASAGTLGAIPVWTSPASLYRADVTSREVFRARLDSAVSMIELDERGPVVTVIPVPSVTT